MTTTQTKMMLTRAAAIAVGAAALVTLGGCRGDRSEKPPRQFFPDLDDQPKWKPQSESDMFANKRTMRTPVPQTVAFGRRPVVSDDDWAESLMREREALLAADDLVYQGVTPSGAYTDTIPVAVNIELLRRGQERYNIYCSVCHGYSGDGKGMVGTQWSYPLPNFHDPKYTDPSQPQGLDGYLFHVALNGVIDVTGAQKMPGYAHALTERDAWAVVAYIRALQASSAGSLEDVPESQRPQVRQQMERAAAAAPQTGAPAGGQGTDGQGTDGQTGGSQ